MIYDDMLVGYGELTVKGGNGKRLVSELGCNRKKGLMGLEGYKVNGNRERMYIEVEGDGAVDEMVDGLSGVLGIG
ncbi:hypothetical protein [Staphylococcus auricularis]|uniref:hypothetical protein n=1 Tax=Staphylococcus auricularis TaxID=29379 RepID=UPI001243E498|nr:hypothetical protein [Staphylococcus auricularis]